MKRYDLSREAQLNIKKIRRYSIDNWGDRQAVKYITQLREQMRHLAQMPTLGTHRSDIDDSVYAYPYESHMIYFTVTDSGIAVAGILHQRMLPENHLKI